MLCLRLFTLDIKLEWVDDILEPFEDREDHKVYKVRRAASIIASLITLCFAASVTLLFFIQTGNLLRGQTTSERYANKDHRK